MKKLLSIFIMLSTFIFSSWASAETAVIVNAANTNEVNQSMVKRMFLGKMKKYPSGSSVIPINLPAGDVQRDGFDDAVLGKSPKQMKSYWSKLVFTGKGNPPQEVASIADMLQLISTNPDAIGYLPADQVADGMTVLFTF
ncbi:MAG: phosphate ABC transporter substrate-binding protein [Saccharospirillaceae bacterium]|nr:phosphate ABC transporter substrate-binding protein [Pseudomonadales bacterium]NRB77837.1 phosphate ABC transporter substrate-binding protein [Saccharospirillaceae bacterium]